MPLHDFAGLSISHTAALGDQLLHATAEGGAPAAPFAASPAHLRQPVSLDALGPLTEEVRLLLLRVQRLEDWAELVDQWGTQLRDHLEVHAQILNRLEEQLVLRNARLDRLEQDLLALQARTWRVRWAKLSARFRGKQDQA